MDTVEFFTSLGIDTKAYNSGSHYVHCPKCHDDRKKKGAKELVVNFDTGYCECFHCGWYDHILKGSKTEKIDYTPAPTKPQKFITPEPVFNWIIPDAVIEPQPIKPIRGKYYITWYYRNINDKLTGAKRMEYEFTDDGFSRVPDSIPLHKYTRDSGYVPCMFYERDLYTFPYAKVILVESEKTAAILRKKFKEYLKEFIYLAVSGANGLTQDKAQTLTGREVLICYDCDNGEKQEDGTIKGPKGREGAQTAYTKLAGICKAFVVDIDPTLNDGTDLADIETSIEYIRELKGTQKYSAKVIESIQISNRKGEPWNRDLADSIAKEHDLNTNDIYEMGRVYYQAHRSEFKINAAPLLKKIEHFLIQRYDFKRNSINRRIFYRDKSIKNSTWVFCNFNDIWRLLQHHITDLGVKAKDIRLSDVNTLLESDFVPSVNPFEDYFHGLPHWDGQDHIQKLASYIKCTDQAFWEAQFRKALIRMIACTYGSIENRIIMVLVQEAQEKGKDSFLRFLCPPELKEYYKEDPIMTGKDTEISLCQNFMWNITELDSLSKRDVSEIKSIISRAVVKQRRAYGRQEENMQRIVNFWGTTNKDEFLTDVQNTRWLCFKVEEINHKYNDYINNIREVDITKVWAQAWYLYKSGEKFMLTESERQTRDVINHSFEYSTSEKQLIIQYLTPCDPQTPNAEFVTNVEILQYLIKQTDRDIRMAPENIGRAMTQLDFTPGMKKINGKSQRGYYLLRQPLLNGVKHQAAEPAPSPMFDQVPGTNGDHVDNDDLPF